MTVYIGGSPVHITAARKTTVTLPNGLKVPHWEFKARWQDTKKALYGGNWEPLTGLVRADDGALEVIQTLERVSAKGEDSSTTNFSQIAQVGRSWVAIGGSDERGSYIWKRGLSRKRAEEYALELAEKSGGEYRGVREVSRG